MPPRTAGPRLLAFVLLQCVLGSLSLDLLPMWGDEAFTLVTAAESPRRIVEIVRTDIHPPLYFLLAHWWNELPLGSDPLVRMRALSVLFGVATTVFLYRTWLRAVTPGQRHWFLLLWTFSPCLLLYARMARSYSLQVLLASVAIWFLVRYIDDPEPISRLAAFTLSLTALLYTHYVPGIAVWVGVNVLLLLKRAENRPLARTWLLPNLLVLVLYAPWLITLGGALGRWRHQDTYRLTGNIVAEHVLKLGYWFYSFSFGESIAFWMLPVTLLLALPVLWLLWSGASQKKAWIFPVLVAACVAYVGAARWVSYPFIGARLLFLLPLFLFAVSAGISARQRTGTILGILLFASSLAGIWDYFGARDILNAGYLAPHQRIATEIVLRSDPSDTVVWIDGLNVDGAVLAYYLPKSFRILVLNTPPEATAASASLQGVNHVWFIRNTHDISPGHALEQLLSRMMASWTGHSLRRYVPFSPTHRALLKAVSVLRRGNAQPPPEFMLEVWEFQRSP